MAFEKHYPEIQVGREVEDFANILDDALSPLAPAAEKQDRVLSLARLYHTNATRRLALLQEAKDDVDMDADEPDISSRTASQTPEVKQLQREVQTWDLLRRLLPLQYSTEDSANHIRRLGQIADRPTRTNTLQHFLTTNSVAKERRAVLQWLQSTASSGPDIDDLTRDLQQNADRGDIIAHGWLHTRSSIKLKKSVTGWPHLLDRQSASISKSHLSSTGAPLVTQLDPDVTTRQDRKLQPQDEYFERAIWLGCFEHLRRGSSRETIREWCQERTEMWRAVSMSGVMLPGGDDVSESADLRNPVSEADPSALVLWRRMCYSLAHHGGSDDYERAVYGVLSGDIPSVEKVARTWDDHLFANYNGLLRTQLDTFVLGLCPPSTAASVTQNFPAFDAVQYHGDAAGLEKRLIRSLETQESTREEALEPHKALQASFIAREIEEYLYRQGRQLDPRPVPSMFTSSLETGDDLQPQKYFKPDQYGGLRIVTHVYVLVTLLLGLENQGGGGPDLLSGSTKNLSWQGAQENILASYTEFLRRAKLMELIPLYCSILQSPRREEVLSDSMILVTDSKERHTQLQLMKRTGINVISFVKAQVELLFQRFTPTIDTAFEAKTDFKILQPEQKSVRFGRTITPDFIGGGDDVDGEPVDEETIDTEHEHLIRSLEWLLAVEETWPFIFSMGTKIYKYFLRHLHLKAARQLTDRVSFEKIMTDLSPTDDFDEGWYDSADFWATLLERSQVDGLSSEKVMSDARIFREFEALVKALDSLETIAVCMRLSTEIAPGTSESRELWKQVGDAIKAAKVNMQPVLSGWLIQGIQEGDRELADLRQAFLPETVLVYISALHFAGTGLSRDWLLECMELASVVAASESDLEDSFVKAKRVRELLEAFTASSKALAIVTGEKRATGSGNKKLREMGWSRDLWSVKS